MSKEFPDLSEVRLKNSELEKENLELRNQIELLTNELSQKTSILNQISSEHTKLQKQYQEALDKIVELSKKTSDRRLSPEEERIYRLQLAEQASCISTLQDRLWDSDNQRRYASLHSSSSGSIDQTHQYRNITRNSNYNYNYNHNNQEFDCTNSYRRPSFCDPIPNIDKAEKKIISLHHKLLETSKQNDYFLSELKGWSKFVTQIFNIAAEALDEYISFPSDDPIGQRKAALHVVCKLAKAKSETPILKEKYSKMKEKYQELRHYLNAIEKRCDHLSQVTQLKTGNTNNFVGLNSNSDFHDEDLEYIQKMKCMKSKNHQARYQFDDSEIDNVNHQYNRNAYSKHKFDEKKIENYSMNNYFDNDNEYDQLSSDIENSHFNRKSYFRNNKNLYKNANIASSSSKLISQEPKTNQVKSKQKIVKTEETERFINPNSNNQSTQSKNKVTVSKRVKSQINETSKQTKFNNTYPKGQSKIDDDSDALYSEFGANISRLSKITKNMKNDYYDFARLSKEAENESFSNE